METQETVQTSQPPQPEIKHLTWESEVSTKKYDGYENVFIANSGQPDAVNDQVNAAGMDLDRFNKNGVVMYQHNGYYSADPDHVIAKGSVWREGDALMLGIDKWDTNELATEVKRKVDEGFINAVSIGFIVKKGRYDDEDKIYYIDKAELLEVSVVNIPADPKAVRVKSIEVEAPEKKVEAPELSETELKKKKTDVELYLRKEREKLS
jgi:HK97 family phage prohead protease